MKDVRSEKELIFLHDKTRSLYTIICQCLITVKYTFIRFVFIIIKLLSTYLYTYTYIYAFVKLFVNCVLLFEALMEY